MRGAEAYEALAAQLDREIFTGMGLHGGRTFPALTEGEPAEAGAGPKLKPVTVGDVWTNPAPAQQFVWGEYLPRGEVTLFGAHGGTGKSTVALMLAVAAVTGRPLFGAPTAQCSVLFVSLEDGADTVRLRLAGICRFWGIDPATLAGRLHVVDGTEDPELYAASGRDSGSVTPTYRELTRLAEGTGAGLVIVDNASDAFGGDEINRRQVRGFMRALARVARHHKSAVCLLAHVDKATSRSRKAEGGEGYSGSTAWHNSARSRLFMSRGADGLLTLEHQKGNLGGKLHEPLTLAWPENGYPELASEAPDTSGFTERAQSRVNDQLAAGLLRILAEFEGRGHYASPAVQARNNVFNLLKVEPAFQALKLTKDRTAQIVNQSQRAGWLEPVDYKSAHTRKYCQRWAVTDKGRDFAGLPAAPTSPTCTHMDVSAEGAPGAHGVHPQHPHVLGGVGERARTDEGAKTEAPAGVVEVEI